MSRRENLEIIYFLKNVLATDIMVVVINIFIQRCTHIIKLKVFAGRVVVTILWCTSEVPMSSKSFAILTSWTTTASK